MEQYYTNERNVQILIALLKEHRIKEVIASPGSTNITFVSSSQQIRGLRYTVTLMNVRPLTWHTTWL